MKPGTTIAFLLILTFCPYLRGDAQSLSGVINSYYQLTAVHTVTNSVTVDDATGLTPGQRVLIIQAKGASIGVLNAASFGDLSALNGAGNYELNTICNISGNEVTLKEQLLNTYDPAGQVQLVSVPSYHSVTVSGTVNGVGWDPATGKGGVVVLEAADTIYLNADIDVSGLGFQGGALVNYPTPTFNCDWFTTVNNYFLPVPASGDFTGGKKGEGIAFYILNEEYGMGKLANGGGGGNNANTGGAGGGNYGHGGDGGQRSGESFFQCHGAFPGIGGLSLAAWGYSAATNKIFFGGGGGSGHENNAAGLPGGNGGGILILSAPVIAGGGGSLIANGLAPYDIARLDPLQAEGDGGGGGGAGGTVILNAATITGSVTVNANGANGSDASNQVNDCTGPGGGGGGGIVWSAGASFPATVLASVNGGANGVVSAGSTKASCRGASNGAQPGAAGVGQAAYTAPESFMNICVPLASTLLKYFNAVPEGQPDGQTGVQGGQQSGGQYVLLSWALANPADAEDLISFTIERSVDQLHFSTLATIAASADSTGYQYTDPSVPEGAVLYRLTWLDQHGARFYSRTLAVNGAPAPVLGSVRLFPDPAYDQLSVEISSRGSGNAILTIFDPRGRQLTVFPFSFHTGSSTVRLPVKELAPGTYFLVTEVNGRRLVKPFVKNEHP